MIEIKPKYEVLYNDLVNLNVGEFLISREFKRMLLKLNLQDIWYNIKKRAEKDRNFISVGINLDKYDAKKALILVLNNFDEGTTIKKFIYNLIIYLITYKKKRTDFNDLIDSIELLEFEEKYQNNILNQINSHNEIYPISEIVEPRENKESNNMKKQKRIFLVHGHDDGILQSVARVIEKQNLIPDILKEKPNGGLTIIEKLEANSGSDFAIIILTGDDHGSKKDIKILKPRARQNVIFEMGYFFALLGRDKVVCLYEEGVELPSDIDGNMYIKLNDTNSWKFELINELKHAGFNVTADKL